MNVVERAREGYGRNADPIKSFRAAEYEAIARVSHRLRSAAQSKETKFAEFASAVLENNKLWTRIAMDVAHPDNGLPQELRARLFWLSEFTSKETRSLLSKEGDVAILIEINAAILHGLRGPEKTS